MSRVEDFDSEYWSDPDLEPLSLEASHLYIWSWTNDRVGPAGIYKVTRRAMLESKIPDDRLDAALTELADCELAFYDGTYMFVKARVKRLRIRTMAMCKGIAKAVAKVPAGHPYRVQFMARYGAHVWRSGDHATTIAGEVERIDGGTTPVKQGSYPQSGDVEPNPASDRGRSPDLQGQGQGQRSLRKEGVQGEKTDEPPADFPEHLNPALTEVVTVLRRIAAARDANHVTVAATARALASYPRRPHRKAAEDLEHWLVHGTGRNAKVRDVVGYYRNQLERRWQDAAESPAGQTVGNGSRFVAAINSRRAGGAAT